MKIIKRCLSILGLLFFGIGNAEEISDDRLFSTLYATFKIFSDEHLEKFGQQSIDTVVDVMAGIAILVVIFYGYRLLFNPPQQGGSDLILRIIKISIIFVIITSFTAYEKWVIDGFEGVENFLTEIIADKDESPSTATVERGGSKIEVTASPLYFKLDTLAIEVHKVADTLDKASGLISKLAKWLVILAGYFLMFTGFVLMLFLDFLKIALIILGPVFFVCMLFQSTRQYFLNWIETFLNLILAKVIVVLLLTITFSIVNHLKEGVIIPPVATDYVALEKCKDQQRADAQGKGNAGFGCDHLIPKPTVKIGKVMWMIFAMGVGFFALLFGFTFASKLIGGTGFSASISGMVTGATMAAGTAALATAKKVGGMTKDFVNRSRPDNLLTADGPEIRRDYFTSNDPADKNRPSDASIMDKVASASAQNNSTTTDSTTKTNKDVKANDDSKSSISSDEKRDDISGSNRGQAEQSMVDDKDENFDISADAQFERSIPSHLLGESSGDSGNNTIFSSGNNDRGVTRYDELDIDHADIGEAKIDRVDDSSSIDRSLSGSELNRTPVINTSRPNSNAVIERGKDAKQNQEISYIRNLLNKLGIGKNSDIERNLNKDNFLTKEELKSESETKKLKDKE